jgi:hypothetical protein
LNAVGVIGWGESVARHTGLAVLVEEAIATVDTAYAV